MFRGILTFSLISVLASGLLLTPSLGAAQPREELISLPALSLGVSDEFGSYEVSGQARIAKPKNKFPYGTLKGSVKGNYTITVVPAIPEGEVFSEERDKSWKKWAKRTSQFWAAEIDGVKLKLVVTKPWTVPKGGICGDIETRDWQRAMDKSGPRKGQLLIAETSPCKERGLTFLENFGTHYYPGYAPEGYEIGAYASTLFGRLLGLKASGDMLACTKDGKYVFLSKRCFGPYVVSAPVDMSNIMSPFVPSAKRGGRLGAANQCLIGVRCLRVANGDTRTVSLVSNSHVGSGPTSVVINTPYGELFIEPKPHNFATPDINFGYRDHAGALMFLWKDGEVRPLFALGPFNREYRYNNSYPDYPEAYLDRIMEIGTYWDIPGTDTRVIISGASPGAVDLKFVSQAKAKRMTPPPSPEVSVSNRLAKPGDDMSDDDYEYEFTWDKSTSNVLAYQLVSAGQGMSRFIYESVSSKTANKIVMPYWPGDDDTDLRIRVIDEYGNWSISKPITREGIQNLD